MTMSSTPDDDCTARADMLRLLNAFGSDDPFEVEATIDAVLQTGDVQGVLRYLLGTTYGLFVCAHGLEPTRDLIKRELVVAEDMEKL